MKSIVKYLRQKNSYLHHMQNAELSFKTDIIHDHWIAVAYPFGPFLLELSQDVRLVSPMTTLNAQ